MKLKRTPYFQLLQNMGWSYVLFRVWYALQRFSGLLVLRFPTHRHVENVASIHSWRDLSIPFFFQNKECLQQRTFSALSKLELDSLKQTVQDIENGRFRLFYTGVYEMPDWHVNPINRFVFDKNIHWSKIPTLSSVQGDIKYVWDKSRFGFFYDIIRYDFHAGVDKSQLIFDQIQDWIIQNPVNCGPNWICSQEIGIRLLNWTFALHYYKNAKALDNQTFQNILNSIFRQAEHIADNMSFAQHAVRNNHILTESLALYVVGTCYPFFDESLTWKTKGMKVFQSEIGMQIDDAGTYLQHSMNYHRMVVQLLSWAIRLAALNGDCWNETLYEKAKKSVLFLRACQDPVTGWLPNYGHNDGSLLFALTNNHFRDFTPQVETLSILLDMKVSEKSCTEELNWISSDHGLKEKAIASESITPQWSVYKHERYVMAKNANSLTFLHCGAAIHRPFQADQLHLDIWIDGVNILRDAGTYQYNVQGDLQDYFVGTKAHNTVIVGNEDQMLKGRRFIWYNWIENAHCQFFEEDGCVILEGKFEGFKHIKKGIFHHRKVTIYTDIQKWVVEDQIEGVDADVKVYQYWHSDPSFDQNYILEAYDAEDLQILQQTELGWYSENYSQIEKAPSIYFVIPNGYIKTIIEPKYNRT